MSKIRCARCLILSIHIVQKYIMFFSTFPFLRIGLILDILIHFADPRLYIVSQILTPAVMDAKEMPLGDKMPTSQF